jgi:hypothetical protein
MRVDVHESNRKNWSGEIKQSQKRKQPDQTAEQSKGKTHNK